MKRLITILILILTACSAFAQERPYTKVESYFKGTNYELNVYRIYGRKDGKTMLVIGGIQGDEPGGFLSADLYADLNLEKGNLIIVPRANFKSVMLYDRGPDGDMNRRFLDEPEKFEMDKVVSVVKKLMGEADVFVNLHDGWGFHSPVYQSWTRSPERFGQSVITDADSFKCTDGRILDLKGPATDVVEAVNNRIDNPDYRLHYFNTNTLRTDTEFADMRKASTYYALRTYCIPAFAVEASKNIKSDEDKVLYHNYAVNEFMRYYGIVPEVPSVIIEKPVFDFVMVSVNGDPVKVDKGGTLNISRGDVCQISHIEANYDRGLSADLLGYGTLNDMDSKFTVKSDAVIVVRKDSKKLGYVNIKVNKTAVAKAPAVKPPVIKTPAVTAPAAPAVKAPVIKAPAAVKPEAPVSGYVFMITHNGKAATVKDGETYDVKKGDTVELKALAKDGAQIDVALNLKGYVASFSVANNGDDRNISIQMNPKRFMKKYAEDDAKMTYPIVAGSTGNELATFHLRMR